ncbi:MAG: HEAT repeat domain-containing protein [Terriglobales bacterium]
MNCDWVKANVTLYVHDELPDDARYELEQHVHRCAGCAAELAEISDFKAKIASLPVPEPSANLLAACRWRLQEALETAEQRHGWHRWVPDLGLWLRSIKFAPALAAAIFIIGFGAGIGATYRVVTSTGRSAAVGETGAATSAAVVQPVSMAEATIAGIRGVTQQVGSNRVHIRYDIVVPHNIEGSLDDPRIQQLLMFAAHNNPNSGVRMDSVDLLTHKPEDTRIREALIYALRYDANPGVRLKAIEGLGPYVKGDLRVRNAVLEALMKDSNPGVRTQAINMLKQVRGDGAVRQVLGHLAQQDRNPYIRNTSQKVLASMPQMY